MRSKHNGTLLLTVLAMALCLAPLPEARAQETETPQAAGAAAGGALEHSLGVARRTKDYGLMGLRSKAEIDQAVLGSPLPLREIGYDLLVELEEGADTAAVFTGPDQLFYPVLVSGEVRSAVTLVRADNDWQLTGYGDAGRAQEIQKTRAGLEMKLGRSEGGDGEYSLVSVPAFQLMFVATVSDGETLLQPLSQNLPPELELEGAHEMSEVIDRLSKYAKEFDEKYGEQIRARKLVK